MSLQKGDVIDLVSLSADGETVTLHLVATEPWPATGEGTFLLQAKLKGYVAFAADGQLTRQYPEASGKRVVIEIRSDHPLGATEEKFVAAAREHWCKPEGIVLLVSAGPTR
jgi:hypothetical protein